MRIKPLSNQESPFGSDYSVHIGASIALKLIGRTLKMGYEYDYCTVNDKIYSDFKHRLTVANYSGTYFLQSSSWPKSHWNSIFGVEIIGVHE